MKVRKGGKKSSKNINYSRVIEKNWRGMKISNTVFSCFVTESTKERKVFTYQKTSSKVYRPSQ